MLPVVGATTPKSRILAWTGAGQTEPTIATRNSKTSKNHHLFPVSTFILFDLSFLRFDLQSNSVLLAPLGGDEPTVPSPRELSQSSHASPIGRGWPRPGEGSVCALTCG